MGKTKTFSKKAASILIAVMLLIVATVALSGTMASAETSGDFTYTVSNGNATITGYSGSATNLVIPSVLNGNTVTAIGKNAFTGNGNLISVSIPSTVTSFVDAYYDSEGAFHNCSKLQTVTFAAGTADVYIGKRTFQNCAALTSIDLPGNYATIGNCAFADCKNLTSVTYNKSSYEYANQKINEYAFSGCSALETVSLPTTLKTIANHAFQGTSIVDLVIPEGVTSIGKAAFRNCGYLTSVSIPSTVTTFEDSYYDNEGAFQNCTRLQTVTIAAGSKDAYIGKRTFQGCTSLTNIEIPGNYATIGNCAFADCKNLTSATYNKSSYEYANQKINEYAFSGCSALETVSLPTTLKTIANHAFQGTSIVDLVVPEGVTSIGKAAFRNCGYLTSVSIPSTVTTFEDSYYDNEGAFQNCTRLQTVTIAAGSKDAYIGKRTFQGCTSLTNIEIPGNYATIGNCAFADCKNLTSATYNKSSYEYANQKINEYAFSGCSALETVSLPTTLKTIANHAFQGTSIVDLVIPEGVTSIGKAAFRNCGYLTSVSIPSTVTTFEDSYYDNEGAFQNCTRLQTVTIAAGSKDAYIGKRTFQGCTSLTNIEIPGNYATIGNCAFADCKKLTSVVYKKSSNAYANQKINEYAFSGCSTLKTVSLPTTLKTIANHAFQSTAIVNLVIPEGVTFIGKAAFRNCGSLTAVSFPSTLTSIEGAYYDNEGAFQNCPSLTTAIFAEGEKDFSIGNRTFQGCTGLTTVHLPLNFVSAGKYIFDGSKTNLTICAKSADSYAKTYADANGIAFVLCNGEHILPEIPTTYTLTYDANGGTGAPAAQTGAETYTVSSVVPVRSGYKFLGWALDKNATVADCTGGANITLFADTVLYAVWEKAATPPPVIKTYKLTYDANGGTGAPAAQTGASEYKISTTVPVRSGYKFLGWAFDKNATSAACTGGENITLTSDTVLYAVWEKTATPPPVVTTYTLSYNANGGSGAPAAQTGASEYKISATVPVRNGYKFLGWATSASATTASYTAGKTITLTKNTTLYAVWQVIATEPAKYVCPYCGEKFGEENKYEEHYEEEIVSRNIAVVFQNPSRTLIEYGDAIVLHVDTYNLPAGSTIKWSVNNGNFAIVAYSADEKSCTITPNATGDTVITATVYDAEGREICSDSQMMSAKAGLWQKIVAFFKKLFGLNETFPALFKVR